MWKANPHAGVGRGRYPTEKRARGSDHGASFTIESSEGTRLDEDSPRKPPVGDRAPPYPPYPASDISVSNRNAGSQEKITSKKR